MPQLRQQEAVEPKLLLIQVLKAGKECEYLSLAGDIKQQPETGIEVPSEDAVPYPIISGM